MFEGKEPDSLLTEPIRFEVLTEGYKIRFMPKFDDSTMQQWNQFAKQAGTGNIIGKLSKGTTGTAVGKQRDKNGREWWYVELDEGFVPKENLFDINDNFPTRIIGWISNRFLRRI